MSMIETFYKVSGTIQHERDGETFDIDYVADIGPEDNCDPEIPDDIYDDCGAITDACYADAYEQIRAARLDPDPQPADAPDRAGQEATAGLLEIVRDMRQALRLIEQNSPEAYRHIAKDLTSRADSALESAQ